MTTPAVTRQLASTVARQRRRPRPLQTQPGQWWSQYNTVLPAASEPAYQSWRARYAPNDSTLDYDMRGAYAAGLTPDPRTGHWPDTFKKPNEPTFSNESQYAPLQRGMSGYWNGGQFIRKVRFGS